MRLFTFGEVSYFVLFCLIFGPSNKGPEFRRLPAQRTGTGNPTEKSLFTVDAAVPFRRAAAIMKQPRTQWALLQLASILPHTPLLVQGLDDPLTGTASVVPR